MEMPTELMFAMESRRRIDFCMGRPVASHRVHALYGKGARHGIRRGIYQGGMSVT